MTDIKEYIRKNKLTQKRFAEEIGVTDDYLSRLLTGKLPITEAIYEKIEVTFNDFNRHQNNPNFEHKSDTETVTLKKATESIEVLKRIELLESHVKSLEVDMALLKKLIIK